MFIIRLSKKLRAPEERDVSPAYRDWPAGGLPRQPALLHPFREVARIVFFRVDLDDGVRECSALDISSRS